MSNSDEEKKKKRYFEVSKRRSRIGKNYFSIFLTYLIVIFVALAGLMVIYGILDFIGLGDIYL